MSTNVDAEQLADQPVIDPRCVEEYKLLTKASADINNEVVTVLTVGLSAAVAVLAFGIDKQSWVITLLPVALLASSGLYVFSEVQTQVFMDAYVARYHEPDSPNLKWQTRLARADQIDGRRLKVKKLAVFPLCSALALASWFISLRLAVLQGPASLAVDFGLGVGVMALVIVALRISGLNRQKLSDQYIATLERVDASLLSHR